MYNVRINLFSHQIFTIFILKTEEISIHIFSLR